MKLLVIFFLLCTTFAANATDFWVNNLRYYVNPDSNSVSVFIRVDLDADAGTKAPSISGEVIISDSVTYKGKTYAVTKIGDSAFARCDSITSVTLSANITSIDLFAFSDCSTLTSIVL